MELRLDESQEELKAVAAKFVRDNAPPDRVTGWFQDEQTFQPELFRRAAAAGWLGMFLSEELGGGGAGAVDMGVVFEQLGRAPIPGPLFASAVLAPALIAGAAPTGQQKRLLPELCRGESVWTVGLSDSIHDFAPSHPSAKLERVAGRLVLSGRKRFVHDVQGATTMLCTARSADETALISLDLSRAGVRATKHEGFLSSLFDVDLEDVEVPADDVLATIGSSWESVEREISIAGTVLAAYQVGGCQAVLDMTVAYTNERVLFGQPIGRLQRVQDHVVELANHLDSARWITYEALWRIDEGDASPAVLHEAQAVAAEAYYEACNYAHMVFAGPGTALDHPLVPHTITSRMLYQYLGKPEYHKQKMVSALFAE